MKSQFTSICSLYEYKCFCVVEKYLTTLIFRRDNKTHIYQKFRINISEWKTEYLMRILLGVDDDTVILRENSLDLEKERIIIERIKNELDADDVIVEHGLALIMIVGEGMRHNVGTTARASKALSSVGINIEMINQGSSEVSIVFGIKARDEHKAVNALYNAFFAPWLVGVSR